MYVCIHLFTWQRGEKGSKRLREREIFFSIYCLTPQMPARSQEFQLGLPHKWQGLKALGHPPLPFQVYHQGIGSKLAPIRAANRTGHGLTHCSIVLAPFSVLYDLLAYWQSLKQEASL